MSMMHKLFRPGKGAVHARFTTAYVNNTNTSGTDAVYPGDLVCWDTTAPTSQGASGVVGGKTLGATDFVFVILPPAAAALAAGLQAGIVQGNTNGLSRNAGSDLMEGDQLCIVQTWGVCPDIYAVTYASSAAGCLLRTGATTGAVTQLLATAADATTVAGPTSNCGFALNAQATDHARETLTTAIGLDAFIRCDF